MLRQLKELVQKLEREVTKGREMRLAKGEKRRRRDWVMDQVNKLRWTFLESEDVKKLINQIYQLTQTLPQLYRTLDRYEFTGKAYYSSLLTMMQIVSLRKCKPEYKGNIIKTKWLCYGIYAKWFKCFHQQFFHSSLQ